MIIKLLPRYSNVTLLYFDLKSRELQITLFVDNANINNIYSRYQINVPIC